MPHGSRGLLATAAGSVQCDLVPLDADERDARYELRVTNGTSGPLAAKASAVRVGEGRAIAVLALEVAPHAAIRTGFTLDASLAYERVSAEVIGEGVHLVVEASPPRGGRPRRWAPVITALGVAALLAAGTLGVFGFARPRVLDAGLVATRSGTLIAQWRTAGSGRRSYELRDARGGLLAQGTLPAAQGALPVGHGDAASLRVAIGNAFGTDARDAAYARATAAPAVRILATPPPRLASLTVDAPRPREPLTVRYSAHAREVRLAIIDGSGRTWFRTTAPGGSGVTQIPAPPAGPGEPYALIATAEGAGAREATRVPLAVMPAAAPSPGDTAPAGPAASAAPAAAGTGGGDFAIRPAQLDPGKPFIVEIPFGDGARVALVRNADGAEIASTPLAPGERSAAFIAPPRGGYVVRVTLRRGTGEDVLVRPLAFTGS